MAQPPITVTDTAADTNYLGYTDNPFIIHFVLASPNIQVTDDVPAIAVSMTTIVATAIAIAIAADRIHVIAVSMTTIVAIANAIATDRIHVIAVSMTNMIKRYVVRSPIEHDSLHSIIVTAV
jgi:hypothetical protein